MFTERTYQMLKEYTIGFLTEEKRTQYLKTQGLSELAVFEGGNKIFISLHLPEANTKPDHLHDHEFFELKRQSISIIIPITCLPLLKSIRESHSV